MIDKSKVIEALEHCQSKVNRCEGCSYKDIGTADMPCLDRLMRDAQYLLEQQETPQPVRESTSDFVRLNKGNIIINRRHVGEVDYYPDENISDIYIDGVKSTYKGNIINKITGGE